VENIKQKFTVITRPTVQKINLNTATASDLATLPFISFQLAKEIVDYRLLHQGFTNLEQLKEVNDFPVEKFERFTLYLALD
jgi:competence protein ComEA